jgi:hypothetical protein
MPKQATHLPIVREWLTSLGVLAAVSLPRDEAQMRLAAFIPLLMDRFPDAAFTPDSLQHVAARAVKGFPTYGELAAWLSEWWRENRPRPVALAPPPAASIAPWVPPTDEERAYVRACVQQVAAILRSPLSEREPDPELFHGKPRYLTPEQLDIVNPLPTGRKRHAPNDAATAADPSADAAFASAADATTAD